MNPTFASLTSEPNLQQILTEHVVYQLAAVVVVFFALFSLYMLCAAFGSLFQRVLPAPGHAQPPDAETPAHAAPSAGDELTAVIAAAVAAVIDQPHRVLSVQPVQIAGNWMNAWAMEGRYSHFSSHKVR